MALKSIYSLKSVIEEEEFGILGKIISSYGLFTLGKWQLSNGLRLVLKVPTFFGLFFYLIQTILFILNGSHNFAFDLSWIAKNLINLYAYILISRKGYQMTKIMKRIRIQFNNFQAKRANRLCFVFGFLWLFVVVFNFIIFICWCNHVGVNNYLLRFYDQVLVRLSPVIAQFYAFSDLIFYPFIIDGFFAVVILIYTFMFYATGLLSDKNLFEAKSLLEEENRSNEQLSAILRQLRLSHIEVQKIRKEVNEILSALPFLWLSALFFESCYRLLHLSNATFAFTETETVYYWAEFVSIDFIILIMIYFVGDLNCKDEAISIEMQSVVANLIGSSERDTLELYAEKLLLMEQSKKFFKVNAWDMFTIKRQIVLTFLGAVIPFCVMAFQLTQKNKSSDIIAFPTLSLTNSS